MTTGWGNEQAQDTLRRSMANGSSGRLGILLVLLGFLVVGILASNIFLIVVLGIMSGIAALSLVRSLWTGWRLGRRRPSS